MGGFTDPLGKRVDSARSWPMTETFVFAGNNTGFTQSSCRSPSRSTYWGRDDAITKAVGLPSRAPILVRPSVVVHVAFSNGLRIESCAISSP